MRLFVRERDLAGSSAREVRLLFFRQFAEPLYRQGPEGLAALAGDPQMRKDILSGGAVFNVLTRQTHQVLQQLLLYASLGSLALLWRWCTSATASAVCTALAAFPSSPASRGQ